MLELLYTTAADLSTVWKSIFSKHEFAFTASELDYARVASRQFRSEEFGFEHKRDFFFGRVFHDYLRASVFAAESAAEQTVRRWTGEIDGVDFPHIRRYGYFRAAVRNFHAREVAQRYIQRIDRR